MSIDFYKVAKKQFVVTTDDVIQEFECIDKACDYLETLSIKPEEVEYALIDMAYKGNTHAHFGALNGTFILSDLASYE